MSAPASGQAGATRIQSAKSSLRTDLLARRRAREHDHDADERRCAALLALAEVAGARVVTGYAALPGEPDIAEALTALRQRGTRVLLPVILPDRDLEFREAGDRLVPGPLGIAVPPPDAPPAGIEEAAVVIVPALAADHSGHRLGRGGGSYDRALQRRRTDALVVAIVHPQELLEEIPVEDHDVPVDAVLAGDKLVRVRP